MTNREWLNTLDDEELLITIAAPCRICSRNDLDCEMDCDEAILEWLKQEHKEDNHDD